MSVRLTPERWARARSVAAYALDLEGDARDRYVQESCGDDAELRHEVRTLLEADASAGRFLSEDAARLIEQSEEWPEQKTVDVYRLVSVLGEGGMGKVFLAERADGQFQQKVALKRLKAFVSGEARARFLRERQILARLEHPAIARLLDGGVVEGTPYFVMEYAPGRPIHEHCAERALGVRATTELFLSVCDAVAFAHRHLVVHRDLKPANVVVTDDGQVKLLDFGIAKLLDADAPDAAATATRARPMTPDYAAPEQIRGEPITTATDVFALGLLLYELLTGRRPFPQGRDLLETAQAILEADPLPPSAAAPARKAELRGDLEAIVLKALEKAPARRYPSAAELAGDLRRHLSGERVEAQAYSRFALARRWVRRHRVGVAVAAGVAAAMLSVGVVSFRRVVMERDRADRLKAAADARRAAAEHLAEFLVAKFAEELEKVGRLDLLGGLGQEVQAYYDAVDVQDPSGTPDARERRAKALDAIGTATANGGDRERALAISETSLQLRLANLREEPASAARTRAVANNWSRIGDMRLTQGRREAALEAFQQALRYTTDLARAHPEELAFVRNAARIEMRIAEAFYRGGQPEQALATHRSARARLEAALAKHPGDEQARADLAWVEATHGNFHRRRGELDLALPLLQSALARRRDLVDEFPTNMQYRADLAWTHSIVGLQHLMREELEAAGGALAAARELREWLTRRDPGNAEWQGRLAEALRDECDLERTRRRFAAADASCRRALEIDKAVLAKAPSSNEWKYALSQGWLYVSQVERDRGNAREAVSAARQALEIREALCRQSPGEVFWATGRALAAQRLGEALAGTQPGAAAGALEQSVALTRELVKRDPANRVLEQSLAERLLALAEARLAAGRLPEADAAVSEALPVLERLAAYPVVEPDVLYHRAEALLLRADLELRKHNRPAARDAVAQAQPVLARLESAHRLTAKRQAAAERARRISARLQSGA